MIIVIIVVRKEVVKRKPTLDEALQKHLPIKASACKPYLHPVLLFDFDVYVSLTHSN